MDEEGLLNIYMLEGSLLRSVRCVPGTNRVDLPSRKGMMILRYVTTSGRCKSLKMMYVYVSEYVWDDRMMVLFYVLYVLKINGFCAML